MNTSNIEFHYQDVQPTIDEQKISHWIHTVLKEYQKEAKSINVIFCTDDYLLEINRQHLQHDYYTDIITFPYELDPIVADLFISLDRVKENAETYSVPELQEILRVIIHGVFHILGGKDKSPDEELEMRNLEDNAIQLYFKS